MTFLVICSTSDFGVWMMVSSVVSSVCSAVSSPAGAPAAADAETDAVPADLAAAAGKLQQNAYD